MSSLDSLKTLRTLQVGAKTYHYFSLPEAARTLGDLDRLPMSLKVLLENLLRWEDGKTVTEADLKALAAWLQTRSSEREIQYRPARVLMQDFTADQPAVAGRPGDRPLGHGRQVRQPCRFRRKRRHRNAAQRRALCLPALGPERLRQLQRGAAGDRDLPSGQPRIPRPHGLDPGRGRSHLRLPRYPGDRKSV